VVVIYLYLFSYIGYSPKEVKAALAPLKVTMREDFNQIDGIPGGDPRLLNQEDIESIDVLKDASAGAIYGTRAARGQT